MKYDMWKKLSECCVSMLNIHSVWLDQVQEYQALKPGKTSWVDQWWDTSSLAWVYKWC